MIVELFGPPGAGKTTFAHKIGEALRERGHAVRVLISARPSETAAVPQAEYFGGRTATIRSVDVYDADTAALKAVNRELMRRLPPHSVFWRFRLRRYLHLLASSWAQSSANHHIVIFDQGYTQALCSLISLTRSREPGQIAAAASFLPEPAVRISVEVPRNVLIARQQERMRDRSLPERLLELDAATNLAQAGICAELRDIFRARAVSKGGAPLLCPDPMLDDLGPLADAIADTVDPIRMQPV